MFFCFVLSCSLGIGGLAIPPKGPDYLNYDIAGRGWTERTSLNVGTTYLIGMGVGGTYGFLEGLRTSPSRKFNIRLNTVLNKMGKRGSAVGNAVGCLALIFSVSNVFCDKMLDTDRFFDSVIKSNRTIASYGTPLVAGIVTGALYKSTMGPKTMFVAAILGGGFAIVVDSTRRFINF